MQVHILRNTVYDHNEIIMGKVSVASHSQGLSLIICTWLESPKAALHTGSYCKLAAHTVVELCQHNIGNIVVLLSR